MNVSPSGDTVQYSDPIETITITATDVVYDTMNALEYWSTDGVNFTTGLPDAMTIAGGLTFSGDANQVGTGAWTLSGIADLAPGTYIVRVTVSDEDGASNHVDIPIEVLQEDALATYCGALFVSTPSVKSGEAVVELRATIQDITAAFPSGPDPDPGNITYAKVSFLDRVTGDPLEGTDGLIAEGLDVTLVDSSDPTVGVAAFSWNVDIGNKDSEIYEIIVRVDAFYTYTDISDITLVTVSKPLDNSITGGGYIINQSTAGDYAGDPGLKTNFGFNVKTNKKRTNVQGHVNIIVRKDGRIYQIKSNATDSLLLNPDDSREAEFTAKANINDITDPLNPISLGGNLSLIATVIDNGEPGDMDLVGFTLWRGADLLFSSNWTGTVTTEQQLDGGNLQVRTDTKKLVLEGWSLTSTTSANMITIEQLEPVVQKAIELWADSGINPGLVSGLWHVDVLIADLPDNQLGATSGSTVWIDCDAAGYGWSFDIDDPLSSTRVDLLSVVVHEFGHVLGFDHDVMGSTLAVGVQNLSMFDSTAVLACDQQHLLRERLPSHSSEFLLGEFPLVDLESPDSKISPSLGRSKVETAPSSSIYGQFVDFLQSSMDFQIDKNLQWTPTRRPIYEEQILECPIDFLIWRHTLLSFLTKRAASHSSAGTISQLFPQSCINVSDK